MSQNNFPHRRLWLPVSSGEGRFGWRRITSQPIFATLVLFALGFAFLSIQTETFLTPRNLAGLLRNVSWLAITALGQSMVVIIGGIDLSVGATMALASLVAASAMRVGLPVAVAVGIGLGVGIIIGWINGMLTAQVRLPPFVVTLATGSIARGISRGLTGGWPVTNLPASFVTLGQSELSLGEWILPLPFILALLVTLLVHGLLRHTVMGGDIYAVSSSERALQVSGVDVIWLKVMVYSLCGLLAALAGLIFTARLGVAQPTAAIGYEIDVVAATIIGGTRLSGGVGTAAGVLFGAVVTQMLSNGLVLLDGPSDWQTTIIGAVILGAVLLDYWRRRR